MDFKGVYLTFMESMWILIELYMTFNRVCETFIINFNRVMRIVMDFLLINLLIKYCYF